MNVNVLPLFSKPVLISETSFDMDENTYKFLEQMKPIQGKSNGSSIDRYVLRLPELKELKNYIQKHLDYYWNEIVKAKNSELYITQSWTNYTKTGENHHHHVHQNSILSGVFYLNDGDENINLYNSNTIFRVSPELKEYNVYNSNSWSIPTLKNKLIIFPSDIRHDVENQKLDRTRMSLAFNTYVKGSLGKVIESTKLELNNEDK